MNNLYAEPSSTQRLTMYQHFYGKLYAAQVLGEFMRHFSNWSEVWDAYRGLCTLPPLRLRNGMTLLHGHGDGPLFLYREMFIDKPYVRRGFYKPATGQTVIDIGANIGWFAAYLQSRVRGIRIHCFEPGPAAIETLRANIEANGLGEFISVYPFAVSGETGKCALARHSYSFERRLLRSAEPAVEADVVDTVTLERALKMAGAASIDLVKIDVEGSEVEIVLGSAGDVWMPVRRVAIEYHEYLRPGCREILIQALRERGFRDVRSERIPDLKERGTIFARK